MVLLGKVVSKQGLCFGTGSVGYLEVLSSNRSDIISLVTNTSVWEGGTALCMSKLVLMQKILGVYASAHL